MDLDTDVLIIGAGLSGLGLAVQLVRQYGHRNFEIIEKTDHIGGTWLTNSYPGCGVDVAAHYYSYSFCLNPNWSRKFPLQQEILDYLKGVASKYDIGKYARFHSIVNSAHWDESSRTWLVTVTDLKASETYHRRCKILVSAVGILSLPNGCDIDGASSFKGPMFHTAQWDHSFDWKDRDMVTAGLPEKSPNSRQAQWIFERPNPPYSSRFQWIMKWVPLAMRAYRAMQIYYSELDFYSFPTESGAGMRKMHAQTQGAYIQRTSPAKYHEFLIPKTEVGCKRRVMDSDYLQSLHRDNVELVYEDPIREIVEHGVLTKSGRFVHADAIVLANGFQVQKPLLSLNLFGEGGVSVAEHWDTFSEGSASSYFGTCLSGFPNFFIMMGPNTASGHGCVTYTTECQINFTLRAIKPVLNALRAQRSRLPVIGWKADTVKVKPDAEQADIDAIQEVAKGMVWSSGCTSWVLDAESKRNTIMYPGFQYKYWLRSIFIPWKDFDFSAPVSGSSHPLGIGSFLAISAVIAVVASICFR
ncbi:Flavin monooxygenase FMO [Penicillium italicum]|uniref:Flavin monooxygenase FMO n=1 Tax=Penicillium italicum TaxID=40296 RepID=A0A0A2KF47_PENIT|nr:Flavin monooxygenase FMO [Penicillium italicum]